MAQGICMIARSTVSAAVASVLALPGLQYSRSTLLTPAKIKHATGHHVQQPTNAAYHECAGFDNVADEGMRHHPLVHCCPGPAEAPANHVTQHIILASCWGTDILQLQAQLPTFHLVFAACQVCSQCTGRQLQAFDSRNSRLSLSASITLTE